MRKWLARQLRFELRDAGSQAVERLAAFAECSEHTREGGAADDRVEMVCADLAGEARFDLAQQRGCLAALADGLAVEREVAQQQRGARAVPAELAFVDAQGLAVERLGFVVATLVVVQRRQVLEVVADGGRRVLGRGEAQAGADLRVGGCVIVQQLRDAEVHQCVIGSPSTSSMTT
jgi:hypothetical protein